MSDIKPKFTNIGISTVNRNRLDDIRQHLVQSSPVPNAKVSLDNVISFLLNQYEKSKGD